jgi:mannosyl-3-phosphoglycerate phosphatase
LKSETVKIIIFTDIDGTLLDKEYRFQDVQPIIKKLQSVNIPIILCSSKTRSEIEYYRSKLDIKEPFISENGAAIFIPKGYFQSKHNCTKSNEDYDIVELGLPYEVIRQKLEGIQKTACTVIGFGDMTAEEVSKDCGLPLALARMAKQREYSEPVKIQGCNESFFLQLIEKEGLHHCKGDRYHHLIGNHDKGKAVSLLKQFYVKEYGFLKTVGVGNGENDLPMLQSVDEPFFITETQNLGVAWMQIAKSIIC